MKTGSVGDNDGSEHEVYVRVAGDDDSIFLDLCDGDRNVVEITAQGWSVVSRAAGQDKGGGSRVVEVRFRRPPVMMALPVPVPGGKWDIIKPFINVAADDDYSLILSWCVASVRPDRPAPILYLLGEHGSAKSTAAKVIRALLDPCKAPLRTLPRDERDLYVSASNGRIICFDNVSKLYPWMSDALCRLATGGGLATRKLYTDDDEAVFDCLRPIIMNGIAQAATRADFLDRSLLIDTVVIDESKRRTEAEFWCDFDAARAQMLGVILNGVSSALRRVSEVKLPYKPRMADFAVFSVAAESGLGFQQNTFEKAYDSNRATAADEAIAATAIGPNVLELMQDQTAAFKGTFAELLARLDALEGKEKKSQDWPGTPRKLSADMKRLAPTLRKKGISYTLEPGRSRTRTLTLTRMGGETSPTSPHPSPLQVIDSTDIGNIGDVGDVSSLPFKNGEKGAASFTCPVCRNLFDTSSGLARHIVHDCPKADSGRPVQ